ncbi:MAG: hypothetical protein ACK5B9_03220 [Flavobacteriia bacterium]
MSKFYEVSKRTGQQMEVYTKQGYNHLYNSNPKNVIKVMLLVFVAILFFVMGKGIILKVKKFFGLSDEQQEYEKEKEKADIATQKELDKQETSDWNPFTTDNTSKKTFGDLGANYEHTTKGLYKDKKGVWRVESKEKSRIEALVDRIYLDNKDFGMMYYPEIVNRIANLRKTKIRYASWYFKNKYQKAYGSNLYDFINDRLSASHHYAPALGVMKSYGFDKIDK